MDRVCWSAFRRSSVFSRSRIARFAASCCGVSPRNRFLKSLTFRSWASRRSFVDSSCRLRKSAVPDACRSRTRVFSSTYEDARVFATLATVTGSKPW
jgi:hypothetical protein